MNIVLIFGLCCCYFSFIAVVDSAVSQSEEGPYLANFNTIMQASYSQVDDSSSQNANKPPQQLISQCKNNGNTNPTQQIVVTGSSSVSADFVQSRCGTNSICIIPAGVELRMDGNLNVGGLIVRGKLSWNSSTQKLSDLFLCGGYIVVEDNGSFDMSLDGSKTGWIYVKNNGAKHPELLWRSFGTFKQRGSNVNPRMEISGRTDLKRTWSLLSEPLSPSSRTMKLLHDPNAMGWKVGDRLGISPTEPLARGWGQVVRIANIQANGVITLSGSIKNAHRADFEGGKYTGTAALMSAEVINLSRNIIITGDDFQHVQCRNDLPESVPGEQTSVQGCRCSSYRSKCTMGLHTMQKHGGVTRITNTRVEKCGQRGVEGKYCFHFHKMGNCPDCLFKGNAVENSQQRGIIVHGTHGTRVEDNVLYNVRGASVYLEDGNEMWNSIEYNVAICPFPFDDNTYHGCTVPGTSNDQADTELNQSGFFSNGAASNNFIGNRASNHFNGVFLLADGNGRGEALNKVCESASRIGRFDGNTWHGNGRFGTYLLGENYPLNTDQSITNNGYNVNKELCKAFDSQGRTRGLPAAIVNHIDYGNQFVGQYEAGDIQYHGHHSVENVNSMYWKETKTFENGCGSHILNAHYAKGNMLLPDQATFIIDNTVVGDDVTMQANHHCNVGVTGFLCMPQYVLHDLEWLNGSRSKKWVEFQYHNAQGHNANQNHGGIFTLSPSHAATIKAGGTVKDSLFPQGYISLVSNKFNYLLETPNGLCMNSSTKYGTLYDNGILCKTELRALKIYTRGLVSGSAPRLKVEVWFKPNGNQSGSPSSSQYIGFHQVGNNGQSKKQGYSLPVIPGRGHSYRISLASGNGSLPQDWVIEFSDPVIGNRWSKDELILTVAGRQCGNGGLITSQHDRKFIWGGNLWNGFLVDQAWSRHGACVGAGPQYQPSDESSVDCSKIGSNDKSEGEIEPTHCPEKCGGGCNSNSYCDCGTGKCECKPGFSGSNCGIDICDSSGCDEHGFCSARYLGGQLPVVEKACVCESSWQGDRCDRNPCAQLNIDCGIGKCVSLNQNQATCECPDGYFGAYCEKRSPCEGYCKGSFPYFGCASHIAGKKNLGCNSGGGCAYIDWGNDYPSSGFCTYKTYEKNEIFTLPTGPTPAPVQRPTLPPNDNRCGCNKCTEQVWNTVVDGYSCGDRITWVLGQGGNDMASACRFVTEEYPDVCTCTCDTPPAPAPTPVPIPKPTPMPIAAPTPNSDRCGCNKCTEQVWNTVVDGYSCGDRITWVLGQGGNDMASACRHVTEEYPDVCTCTCDTPPTPMPVAAPTPNTDRCDCNKCTEQVWNTVVDGYSCGDRITWVLGQDGNDMASACRHVTEEYPDVCTCTCDTPPAPAPTRVPTRVPTRTPTRTPTRAPTRAPVPMPIPKPTPMPIAAPTPNSDRCGCNKCTEQVWNTVVDGYSCGDRITWVLGQDGNDMASACRFVTEEYPDVCTCTCDTSPGPAPTPTPTSSGPNKCEGVTKKKQCKKLGCKWKKRNCMETPPSPCDDKTTKTECDGFQGCSWRANLCQNALSSSACSKYRSKKRACEKKGCLFNAGTNECKGRWDSKSSTAESSAQQSPRVTALGV